MTKLDAIILLVAPMARMPKLSELSLHSEQHTDQHEPAVNVGKTSGNLWRSQSRDPGVLSSRNRVHGAHFGHWNDDRKGEEADTDKTKHHDRRTARCNSDDEYPTQGGPAARG